MQEVELGGTKQEEIGKTTQGEGAILNYSGAGSTGQTVAGKEM